MSEFETQTQTKTKVDTDTEELRSEEVTDEVAELTLEDVLNDKQLVDKINKEAEQIVEKITTENRSELSKTLNDLSNIGDASQREAGDALATLKRPLKSLMDGKNDEIPKTLLELRKIVGELDAEDLHAKGLKGFMNKMLRRNPIEKYTQKYQTIDKQIDAIIKSLLIGRDNLQADSISLDMLKEDAQQKIYELDKDIYLGRQLATLLDEQRSKPANSKDISTIDDALETTLVRVRDMQESKAILLQSIASIDMLKKTNTKLLNAVRNAITKVRTVVTISTTIQLALNRQKKVIDAVNGTNSAIESMVLANSRSLKQNSVEIAKIMENPAISIEKLRESFNNVFDAITTVEESQARTISSSKVFIEELDKFNEEMKAKITRGK